LQAPLDVWRAGATPNSRTWWAGGKGRKNRLGSGLAGVGGEGDKKGAPETRGLVVRFPGPDPRWLRWQGVGGTGLSEPKGSHIVLAWHTEGPGGTAEGGRLEGTWRTLSFHHRQGWANRQRQRRDSGRSLRRRGQGFQRALSSLIAGKGHAEKDRSIRGRCKLKLARPLSGAAFFGAQGSA